MKKNIFIQNILISIITAGLIVLFCSTTEACGATYKYDNLHRLTRVVYDNGTVITYTYDDVGNRTTRVSTLMADISIDGVVNFQDLAMLTSHWLNDNCGYADEWCDGTDIDWSSEVNFRDYAIWANQWLEGTSP